MKCTITRVSVGYVMSRMENVTIAVVVVQINLAAGEPRETLVKFLPTMLALHMNFCLRVGLYHPNRLLTNGAGSHNLSVLLLRGYPSLFISNASSNVFLLLLLLQILLGCWHFDNSS